MKPANIAIVAVTLSAICLSAQTPALSDLRFEVASIRPSQPGERGSSTHTGNDGIRTRNATVLQLIELAYDVQEYQVAGGPGWVRSDGYNITAKYDYEAEKDATSEQRDQLLRARGRNLLADRFQLKLREETKDLPAYVLVQTKSGHKFKISEQTSGGTNTNRNNGSGKIIATALTLDSYARRLSNILGKPVLNETGLDGKYDLTLEWASDDSLSAGTGAGAAASTPAGVSIFTALQEQLGLKLESRKGPVQILVIENVERPSEN